MKKTVLVNDSWQQGYSYRLSQPAGRHFAPDFQPQLTPAEMLELGIFGGVYFWDRPEELPASWFIKARLSPDGQPRSELNYYQIAASQPMAVWVQKGWIHPDDPRGWFQWYCRYYLGRRWPEEDRRQIDRWRAMARHLAQVHRNCLAGDLACRRRQRQALLHWAYDSRLI